MHKKCPIPNSHDKFQEAHYYLEAMMKNYHAPDVFRWSLNSFLQSLRNVTFVIQKELKHTPGYEKWYGIQEQKMRQDKILKKFVEGRNIVVKEGNLKINSVAQVGLFRGRKLKLVYPASAPVDYYSEELLKHYAHLLIGSLIDEEHSAIGEQIGIKRKWMVDELGPGEIITNCDIAWSRIGSVVASAHKFCKFDFTPPQEHGHDVEKINVLLESDVDSTLPKKWGWE